ncbi:hypothetical protein [Shimia ponticola]|uniref:hypothetical protein n=1 Tax=Shimia ponticola TaxID=2582893 RepID=UPI0011BD8EFE|nr:hypothetical protein [Shimia ponticola]
MLSLSSETGSGVAPWEWALMAVFMVFGWYRNKVRRDSLHQREDGVYVWVEWHGGERTSICDPTEEWDSEGDGGDGGD